MSAFASTVRVLAPPADQQQVFGRDGGVQVAPASGPPINVKTASPIAGDPLLVPVGARHRGITNAHCRMLGGELPGAIDALNRRRASQIPEAHIDDYLVLGWLRWDRGTLVLTAAGLGVRNHVMAAWERP